MVALASLRTPLDQVIGWIYGDQEQTFLDDHHRAQLDAQHERERAEEAAAVGSRLREAAAAGGPLSIPHISPRRDEWVESAIVTSHEGGTTCKLKLKQVPGAQVGGGQRGTIGHYNAAMKKRAIDKLNSVNQGKAQPRIIFCTLTPPRVHPTPRQAKVLLDTWRKRFERAYGPHGAFWKLEPQKRGAPHFHLMIWMAASTDPDLLSAWVAVNWAELLTEDPEERRKMIAFHTGKARGSQPCCQVIRTHEGANMYCSKYLCKLQDLDPSWDMPGRWWGTWHEELLHITPTVQEITKAAGYKVRRQLRRLRQSKRPIKDYRIVSQDKIWLELELVRQKDRCGQVYHEEVPVVKGPGLVPLRPKLKFRDAGMTVYVKQATFERLVSWALDGTERVGEEIPI